MFGELIARCAEVWRLMGSLSRVILAELGPGRGTLMRRASRSQSHAGFRDAIELYSSSR